MPSAPRYALFLADTLLIKEEGGAEVLTERAPISPYLPTSPQISPYLPQVLTERAPKAWGDISYYLKDDDDDDEGPSKSSSSKGDGLGRTRAVGLLP